MPDWSRRHALHVVATAGTLLTAGCSTSTSDPPAELPESRDRVTDFETAFARNTRGNPLIVERATETTEEPRSTEERRRNVSLVEHLTDEDDRDQYQFRTDAGVANVRSLVTQTDFDSESVYLLQRSIEECYQPRLVSVYREDDGVNVDFCQDLRPADVACDAGVRDIIVVAIRLPFAGDGFNSLGTGWSGDCEHLATVELTNGSDTT